MNTDLPPLATAGETLRVAIVGAGPSGIYTADALTYEDATAVEVDLLERLPTPFGLLRYGVAPDHHAIRGAASTLQEVLDRPNVHLHCGVEVGTTLDVEDLRARYDAVVYATGADADRRLEIPGEDVPGSTSATQFVHWYTGHPEADSFDLSATTSVVVVGAGNVALDVVRMLVKDPEALVDADLPDVVLEALRASAVTDVHLLARRGPEDARFTTKELTELACLDGVELIVDPTDLPGGPPADLPPVVRRNLAVLAGCAAGPSAEARRRVHLHFGARPVQIIGHDAVTGVEIVQRRGMDDVSVHHAAQLVVRAVGYRSRPLPGVPFAEETATIPHLEHRVLREGQAAPGEYAVGWVKRGPTGVLGRSRSDAFEVAEAIHHDREVLLARRVNPRLVQA